MCEPNRSLKKRSYKRKMVMFNTNDDNNPSMSYISHFFCVKKTPPHNHGKFYQFFPLGSGPMFVAH